MKPLDMTTLVRQNLQRKATRAIAIGLSVAVAAGSLFFATMLLRGINTSLTVGRARLGADLVVVPRGQGDVTQEAFITGEATSFTMPSSVIGEIAAIEGVAAASPQLYIQTLTNATCCIGEFFLVGYDPQSDFTIKPWLTTHIPDGQTGDLEIIAGDRILLRAGDGATFFGTGFQVAGVLEKTGMGIDRTIYIPLNGVRQMIADSGEKAEQALPIGADEISSVMIKVAPGADVVDVAERIEGALDNVNVFTASQLNQTVSVHLQGIMGTLIGVTVVLWLMSMMMIALVFTLIINERRREFGLLRAMGATRRFIFELVIREAGTLTTLGGVVGILVTGVILIAFTNLIQQRLSIPYLTPSLLEIGLIQAGLLALALLTGVLASLYPAYTSSRLEPYAAIRKGE
jgi:putative ABC transport system permease protein